MPLSIPLPRLTGPLPKISAAQPTAPSIKPEQGALLAIQALPALKPSSQPRALNEDSDVEDDAPTGMISMDELVLEEAVGLGEAQETVLEADAELLDDLAAAWCPGNKRSQRLWLDWLRDCGVRWQHRPPQHPAGEDVADVLLAWCRRGTRKRRRRT